MNPFFRILLIGGIIGLVVVIGFFLTATYQATTQPTQATPPPPEFTGNGGRPVDTPFVSPRVEDVDIISLDFETVLEVDVTREVSFQNLDELVTRPSPEFSAITSEYWMDTKGYIIMTCEHEGEVDKALMMTARYISDPALLEDSFQPAEEAFQAWRPSILRDVGQLIFPRLRGVEGATPSAFEWVPGTSFERATFDVNGQEAAIYSGWVNNYLFLSSSALCLEAAKVEIYAPHTH